MTKDKIDRFYLDCSVIFEMVCRGSMKMGMQEKKEEIWLSPTTKASTPTEKSKKQRHNTKTPSILWLHNECGPTKDG